MSTVKIKLNKDEAALEQARKSKSDKSDSNARGAESSDSGGARNFEKHIELIVDERDEHSAGREENGGGGGDSGGVLAALQSAIMEDELVVGMQEPQPNL